MPLIWGRSGDVLAAYRIRIVAAGNVRADCPNHLVCAQDRPKGPVAMLNAPLRGLLKRTVRLCGYDVHRFDPVRYEPYDQQNIIEGRIVRCVIDGSEVYFFVVDQEDIIQREHLHQRFYEQEELEIIKHAFRGGVFLDVGANVGNHTLFAAMYLGASRVISVEPNPIAYGILRVNVGLNGQHDKITLYPVGLSDDRCRASIHIPSHNLGGGMLAPGAADARIEVFTGDELLSGSTIDFIKIDTEGMELNVIRGLANTIRRDHPDMFVEVEDKNVDSFLRLMRTFGYTIKKRYRRYNSNENFLAVPE
jgi:FkbM family methyltransferase